MSCTSKFLLENDRDILKLAVDYDLHIGYHPTLPLVVLNYRRGMTRVDVDENSLHKRKFVKADHPIVAECRGLVLEIDECKKFLQVVAQGFSRFWHLDIDQKQVKEEQISHQLQIQLLSQRNSGFDFEHFHEIQSKEDGTFMLIYKYKEHYVCSSRHNFGEEIISGTLSKSDLICQTLENLHLIKPDTTYCIEFCSPFNQVVRSYQKPIVFLIGALVRVAHKDNESKFVEIFNDEKFLDKEASQLGMKRPWVYINKNLTLSRVYELLEEKALQDPTIEGFILIDHSGKRLKLKTELYVVLHRLKYLGWPTCTANFAIPLLLKYMKNPTSSQISIIEKENNDKEINDKENNEKENNDENKSDTRKPNDEKLDKKECYLDWILRHLSITPQQRASLDNRIDSYRDILTKARSRISSFYNQHMKSDSLEPTFEDVQKLVSESDPMRSLLFLIVKRDKINHPCWEIYLNDHLWISDNSKLIVSIAAYDSNKKESNQKESNQKDSSLEQEEKNIRDRKEHSQATFGYCDIQKSMNDTNNKYSPEFNDGISLHSPILHLPLNSSIKDFKDFKQEEKEEKENDLWGNVVCFCGGLMKLVRLKEFLYIPRTCHCGYDPSKNPPTKGSRNKSHSQNQVLKTYIPKSLIWRCTDPLCNLTMEAQQETLIRDGKTLIRGAPLGIPASAICKNLRLNAHDLLKRLSKFKKWTITESYQWLAKSMQLSQEKAHMSQMSSSILRNSIAIMQNELKLFAM